MSVKRLKGQFNLLPEAIYEAFMGELSVICGHSSLGGYHDKAISAAMLKLRNGLLRVSINSIDYVSTRHIDVLQVKAETRSFRAGDDYAVYELLNNLDTQETHLPGGLTELPDKEEG